ncbi:cytochrome P450 [Pseudobacteriovorax antillogorgiicola]|uniref:Cytochrome P450 n=1 Tax=Pseudobacteriovorax antillogorgiicola TaxID=1513793 RepID=A0A1Y6BER6_9BACT|nr:cytochrome P450 [Pseudobacteriovorax antillogorgiicola]TCS57562.1 cytochrome P450 [Pseudobacteriovorax antillogorgiicola]SME99767.1 Cytochrome P450 [Pseudobacteriovorax antillogorgiicola]
MQSDLGKVNSILCYVESKRHKSRACLLNPHLLVIEIDFNNYTQIDMTLIPTETEVKDIPGPRPFPLIGHIPYVLSSNPFERMIQLCRRYGGLFRLQLYEDSVVVVTDSDIVEELLDENRFEKRVVGILDSIRPIAGDGLITARNDEENWARAHRVLKPGFGRRAMSHYLPVMIQTTRKLVDRWAKLEGEWLDVNTDFTRLTIEIIGLCGFNYSFNCFEKERLDEFIETIDSILSEATISHQLPPFINRLRPGANKRMRLNQEATAKIFDRIVKERQAKGEWNHHDFLAMMLHGRDPKDGSQLSEENIRYQLISFLIAGHETTRSLLSFTLFFLSKHQTVLDRARTLVDQVFAEGDRDLSFQDLSRLSYLQQILNESLRLWSTAPAFMVGPKEETILRNGYRARKNDTFFIFLAGLHRDPKIWGQNPERFDPDRFAPEAVRVRPAHGYRPFGNGKRSCIGQHFAMTEAQIALAYILYFFDIEGDPCYELKIDHSLTIKPKNFYCRVRKRR